MKYEYMYSCNPRQFYLLTKVLMQERIAIRHFIWRSSGTLLNPMAMLPIMPWIAGVHPSIASCCDATGFEALSAVSNVLANEEMFLEDSSITVSTSSWAVPRFLFLTVSANGVFFWGVIAEAMAFNIFADALFGEVTDFVEVREAENDTTESATEDGLSSSVVVDPEPASI